MKKIPIILGALLLIIPTVFVWRREVIMDGIVASVDPVFSWAIENNFKTRDKIFGDAKSLYVSDLISKKENTRGIVGKNFNHLFIVIAITEQEQNRIIFSNAYSYNGVNNYSKFLFSNREYYALSEFEKILLVVSLADTSRAIDSYAKRANDLFLKYSFQKSQCAELSDARCSVGL